MQWTSPRVPKLGSGKEEWYTRNNMTRHTVLLLFGGESSEHDVSISSARNVYAAIDGEKYDTLLGYIDRNGKWWLIREWTDNLDMHGGSQLLAAPGTGSFMLIPGNTVIHPDVILPVLHGKNGEDGTVQGLAALVHIPIVGCDTTASAVCMDKVLTKQVLESNGIKTVECAVHHKGEPMPRYGTISAKLGSVLFVKPSRAGSSVGVTKVHDEDEFIPAIERALQHDDRVLIERAVTGREIETAALGMPPHHTIASAVGEIIPGAEFYDYDDKYASDSTSQVIVDVDLDADLKEKIRDISRQTFAALGCMGLSRIDYLVEGDEPYVIEVNTFPGFTNISMYPKLWRADGLHYPELVDRLIQDALK